MWFDNKIFEADTTEDQSGTPMEEVSPQPALNTVASHQPQSIKNVIFPDRIQYVMTHTTPSLQSHRNTSNTVKS